jgi:hypothetical protein
VSYRKEELLTLGFIPIFFGGGGVSVLVFFPLVYLHSVSCVQCCLCLYIAHFWLPLQFSPNIYIHVHINTEFPLFSLLNIKSHYFLLSDNKKWNADILLCNIIHIMAYIQTSIGYSTIETIEAARIGYNRFLFQIFLFQ